MRALPVFVVYDVARSLGPSGVAAAADLGLAVAIAGSAFAVAGVAVDAVAFVAALGFVVAEATDFGLASQSFL